MPRARGLATAAALAWRCVLPVVGGAVILGLLTRGEAVPPGGAAAPDPRPGPVISRGEDDVARVTLSVPEGDTTSKIALLDEGGREVLMVNYYRDGGWPGHLCCPGRGATRGSGSV